MRKIIKKLFNILNYQIVSKNSWYEKQQNYVAEINEKEMEIIKNIADYSMCSTPNHWAIIQSIKHISENKVDGDLVEAGVYKGGNLILISLMLKQLNLSKKIYAYDTFEGMPEENTKIDVDLKGKSAKETRNQYKRGEWCYASLHQVKKNLNKFDENFINKIKFIQGKVENTLDNYENIPDKISFLRLDTDFYDSTKKELEILYPRLQKNGILIIDDYGHWKGAKKAVDDYFGNDKKFRFFHRIDYASRLYIKE